MQRLLAIAALVAVAAGTLIGYVVTTDAADERVEERAVALAGETVASTETVVGGAIGGLQGAQALVGPDGVVDREDFAAFGEGVVGDLHAGMALGLVVAGRRPSRLRGGRGTDQPRLPDGTFAPAAQAAEHFPIVAVVSADPVNQAWSASTTAPIPSAPARCARHATPASPCCPSPPS